MKMRIVEKVRAIVFFHTIILCSVATMAQGSGDPTNNLIGSVQIHDPSPVVTCGALYYVYATGGGSRWYLIPR
jgi:hypothetical protein